MNTALRMTKGALPQLIYALLSPAFFIAFTMLYNPFDIKGYFGFGNLGYGFHLLMLSCIILLTLLLTRGLFMLLSRNADLKWWQYALWCLGEAFAVSCFMALYTTLFRTPEANFFQVEADCMKYSFLILVYPYIFLVMWQVISNKENDILSKDEDTGLVKFYDEHKRLKLTIDGNSVLYISAEFNYVNINYIESGKVKSFMLRNSMKSMEANAQEHGLFRCHRSYYVNPRHITMISKGKEGQIHAVLDTPDAINVPISKQYYDRLTAML